MRYPRPASVAMNPFPIFLNDLANRPCLVFGADHEAGRKVKSLLSYRASVAVMPPELTNVLFNAMDDVSNCDFVSGSVIRQGPHVVAISTSGCAPVLSVRFASDSKKSLVASMTTFCTS